MDPAAVSVHAAALPWTSRSATLAATKGVVEDGGSRCRKEKAAMQAPCNTTVLHISARGPVLAISGMVKGVNSTPGRALAPKTAPTPACVPLYVLSSTSG